MLGMKEVLEMIEYQPLLELTRDETDDFEELKTHLLAIRDGEDVDLHWTDQFIDYQVGIIAALVNVIHR